MTAFDADAPPFTRRTIAQRDAFRFWTEEKLRNADTDQFRHVNNAVIATFFEAARMEIFAPPAVRKWMNGANLAVVRLLIEFSAEVHFPDMSAWEARSSKWDKHRFGFSRVCSAAPMKALARQRKPCACSFMATRAVLFPSRLNCMRTFWRIAATSRRLSNE